MSRGRIAQFKKNVEMITDSMVTFSLNPNVIDYNKIISCESLKREAGEYFQYFVDTCMLCYADDWNIGRVDDNTQPIDKNSITSTITTLAKQAVTNPTFSIAVKILYIFYASGQLSFIELFYQLMGWETLPRGTKEQLAQLYRDIKLKYQRRTAQLLKLDPDYFTHNKHRVKIQQMVADFSYFDNIKERAIEEREHNRDHAKALGQ